jgi:hypothetical protein
VVAVVKLLRLASRVVYTSVRLPFAIVWDAVRLPAIASGSTSSVAEIISEHLRQKQLDDWSEREP